MIRKECVKESLPLTRRPPRCTLVSLERWDTRVRYEGVGRYEHVVPVAKSGMNFILRLGLTNYPHLFREFVETIRDMVTFIFDSSTLRTIAPIKKNLS